MCALEKKHEYIAMPADENYVDLTTDRLKFDLHVLGELEVGAEGERRARIGRKMQAIVDELEMRSLELMEDDQLEHLLMRHEERLTNLEGDKSSLTVHLRTEIGYIHYIQKSRSVTEEETRELLAA